MVFFILCGTVWMRINIPGLLAISLYIIFIKQFVCFVVRGYRGPSESYNTGRTQTTPNCRYRQRSELQTQGLTHNILTTATCMTRRVIISCLQNSYIAQKNYRSKLALSPYKDNICVLMR